MDRDKLYDMLYSNDTVYRPPREAGSALLEVTQGCSWHRCRFCDFARDPFKINLPQDIAQKAQLLNRIEPDKTRVFFLGENGFSLSYEQLEYIFSLVHTHMPSVEEIAMYSRVDDILRKTDSELLHLKKLGLSDLHIGVESGCDPILLHMDKGVTATDTVAALRRLDSVGIGYYVTVILGLGGKEYRNMHAIETARMLNRTHPKEIWCLALKLWEGTPLFAEHKKGHFDMMSYTDMLLEERLLLENLRIENCMFTDTTVLGKYTIQGPLQRGKEAMIESINKLLHMEQGEE